jgi:Na+/H+-dicarboxylate symporter
LKPLFLAVLLGILCGYFPHPFIIGSAHLITVLFMNLLKLLSLPLIFLSILATLSNITHYQEAKFLLKRVLSYTLFTTLLAATIGLFLFLVISPTIPVPIHAAALPIQNLNYFEFLQKIIPDNFVKAFIENNVLGVAFISLILSLAILQLPQEISAPLKKGFHALFQAILKIASTLIKFLPFAIFGFTVDLIHERGHYPTSLGYYALCVIGANLIQGFIVLPLLLYFKGVKPFSFAKTMLPALSMAFFSKSSSATLPLTLECAKRAQISDKTATLSLPLCSIINMNGCAAFILITVLFTLSSYGIPLPWPHLIGWLILATLAAIGNAGVPMGCYFLTSAFLIGMNVPLSIMGMILPLYTFFDMVETALNVWSDACVTVIADKKSFRKLNPLDMIRT